jgi:DNA (cytosine-5)-methyltransferase 1
MNESSGLQAKKNSPGGSSNFPPQMARALTSIEICAGAGGQAWGLELAKFDHLALIDNDPCACETLRRNRPEWHVVGPYLSDPPQRRAGRGDVRQWDATAWRGRVDLLAGGVPCPPFSMAGKQLGAADERDLFPAALDLVDDCEPRAVMLENVRGILAPKFDAYREQIKNRLAKRGYKVWWQLAQASEFGVAQLRPRAVLVAMEKKYAADFEWPTGHSSPPPTVGEALRNLMGEAGWHGVEDWANQKATKIAPTLVGGSKKHGGPDLGPTRAKREWEKLGVDAIGLADTPPARDFAGVPRLTVPMAAVLQGFDPVQWPIYGAKTPAYRQVGNAFPPPVAKAFGDAIRAALVPRLVAEDGDRMAESAA